MRLIASLALFALAIWRAVVDWQATISQGNAFRPASIGSIWEAMSPGTHEAFVPELQALSFWDPVLAFLYNLPLLLILLTLALLFWLLRRRKPRQRKIF